MTKSKVATQPSDMQQSRLWTAALLDKASSLPFSFVYDGKKIQGIPETWAPTAERSRIDATIIQTVFRGKDPVTGLAVKVECLEYRDYPVVEWTAWLTNTGSQDSPLVADFLGLDASFAGKDAVLTHCNGDFCNEAGYTPEDSPLKVGEPQQYAPVGGRACDQAFPYYRVVFQNYGLTLSIGWPAQWAATFEQTSTGVQIKAGQEKLHAHLHAGETIRSPRITLMSWKGDVERAINLWRRWYLAHVLPRPNGSPMQPKLAVAATEPVAEEFTGATEKNQIELMDKYHRLGIQNDVWWIDAGWYPCFDEKHERRWWRTGTWEPDETRFPHSMMPISERAAHYDSEFLVWMEPERVTKGSWLDTQHPEWIFKKQGEEVSRLLNLGNPAALKWLIDHINELIKENGIKIYRQDFNFEPLLYWRENEGEDRQGINENLHVQGYLAFWDGILKENPGLWIDSCSSGGRRNDLETMRRSVPLHYSDYAYGKHAIKLAFQRTLYQWIPYFKDCTVGWDILKPGQSDRFDVVVDAFSIYCGFAPMLFLTTDANRDDYDFELAKKIIAIWRKVSQLLIFADFYPLTPFTKANDQWAVRQFDAPESGEGCLQAMRLADCAQESYTASLRGIDPEKGYLFENLESGEKQEVCGKTLVEKGFTVTLPKRSGGVWYYQVMVEK